MRSEVIFVVGEFSSCMPQLLRAVVGGLET